MAIMAGAAVSMAAFGGLKEVGSAARPERWLGQSSDGMSSLAAASADAGKRSGIHSMPFLSCRREMMRASTTAQGLIVSVASVVHGQEETKHAVPLPLVYIDQHSDPEATIVELSFGDRLGALLDTTKALKNLGLNVVKAKVSTDASHSTNKFYITRFDNGNKVENPELLEAIRLTIINNLLKYHPESSEHLFLGGIFGGTAPKTKIDIDVATHVTVKQVNPKQSLLKVETADRPGLLLDIIEVITDINILVESADINTEGLVAKDQFYVSHDGAALSKSLEQVLVNCLRYYIRKADCDEDSY